MATLVPLVVVVVVGHQPGACSLQQADVQEVCEGLLTPRDITETRQCAEPPCNITTGITTLSPPLVLSLPNTTPNTCTTKLYLYTTTKDGCGVVAVQRPRDRPDQLLVEATTCDRAEDDNTTANHYSAPPGGGAGEWVHLQVQVTEGHQVRLYHVQGHLKHPLLTLPSTACLPSMVMVRPCPHQQYGYSTPSPTTHTSPATTSSHTTHTLPVVAGSLAMVVVVVGHTLGHGY